MRLFPLLVGAHTTRCWRESRIRASTIAACCAGRKARPRSKALMMVGQDAPNEARLLATALRDRWRPRYPCR